MKVSLEELRSMIREEYMRGVPEFVLHSATSAYIETIRKYIQKHILMTKKNPQDAREAIEAANEVLKELETEANQLLENKLWQFMQST